MTLTPPCGHPIEVNDSLREQVLFSCPRCSALWTNAPDGPRPFAAGHFRRGFHWTPEFKAFWFRYLPWAQGRSIPLENRWIVFHIASMYPYYPYCSPIGPEDLYTVIDRYELVEHSE